MRLTVVVGFSALLGSGCEAWTLLSPISARRLLSVQPTIDGQHTTTTVSTTTKTRTTALSVASGATRKDFLNAVVALPVSAGTVTAAAFLTTPIAAAVAAEGPTTTLPSGVQYRVVKSGKADAAKPDVGQLAAIRFAAYYNEITIDDIFETPEPYYTRVGSGGLIKGVEEVLPMMRIGDRWVLTIPVRVFSR